MTDGDTGFPEDVALHPNEWIRDSLRRMLDRMERLGAGMREVREHVMGDER